METIERRWRLRWVMGTLSLVTMLCGAAHASKGGTETVFTLPLSGAGAEAAATGETLMALTPAEIRARIPFLKPDAVTWGLLDPSAEDMDVEAMLQGYLRGARSGGAVVRTGVDLAAIERDGAGYKARIVNVLEGARDKWFRPSDVKVAPDGSLIIADWYDPGVGGHNMQDLDRGLVVGINTFGKGLVQNQLNLSEGKLLLTVARYYTPSGRSIQQLGITPDIVVEPIKVEQVAKAEGAGPRREADLPHALRNTDPGKAAPAAPAPPA